MTTAAGRAIALPAWLDGWRERRRRRREERSAPLAFARQKKLLLGSMALLVAVPFPLNEPRPDGVVSWPVLGLYLAAVGFYVLWAWRGRELALPSWALNVLGLLFLPIFLFRLRTVGPFHIARPMVELLLFAMAARFYGLRREREKWHLAILLFFLFVAAMATSVHPLIVLYLASAMALWLLLLLRFLELHLEQTYTNVVPGSRLRSHQVLVAFAGFTVALAIPFFVLLPRLRAPYIMGSGGAGRPGYSTGFRDEVDLDIVGSVRDNPAVALRMKADDPSYRPPTLLRGTTYDLFRQNVWLRSASRQEVLSRAAPGLYRLAPGGVDAKLRIWLEPIDSRSLMIPNETLTIETTERLFADIAGGVLMLRPRPSLLEYRVGVGTKPVYRARVPVLDDPDEPTLDLGGVTPRIEDLSRRLTTGFEGAEAAHRIQQYLGHNMVYTLDFRGREADDPIEDFLFRYQSGHCEYFATSMILMLRSVGIPARLVTGFLGAEFNPLEDYYIVRQSNAHAWVEVYLPEIGWTSFDPTPPAGRPPAEVRPTMRLMLRQTWDYLEFRWDRYVMSYGFFDQLGFVLKVRDWMRRWSRPSRPVAVGPGAPEVPAPAPAQPSTDPGLGLAGWLPLIAGLALAALLVSLVRRRAPPEIATRCYRELRAVASRLDPSISAATGPLALRRWVEARLAADGAQVQPLRLIDLYLLESWSGVRLGREQVAAVRRDLRDLRRRLRRRPPTAAGR